MPTLLSAQRHFVAGRFISKHGGLQPSVGCWKDVPSWWRNMPCHPLAGDTVCRPHRGATAGGGFMSTRQHHAGVKCGPLTKTGNIFPTTNEERLDHKSANSG